MIDLAVECAEEQMLNRTASPLVLVHYLKLGTEKYRFENEKLKAETELQKAKVQALSDMKEMKEMYEDAMRAFRTYNGQGVDENDY